MTAQKDNPIKSLGRLYKRVRYWRQLRKGYGLLEDVGHRVEISSYLKLEKKNEER